MGTAYLSSAHLRNKKYFQLTTHNAGFGSPLRRGLRQVKEIYL